MIPARMICEFGLTNPVTPELKSDGADTDPIFKRIKGCVKDISLGVERWDDPYAVDRVCILSSNVIPWPRLRL